MGGTLPHEHLLGGSEPQVHSVYRKDFWCQGEDGSWSNKIKDPKTNPGFRTQGAVAPTTGAWHPPGQAISKAPSSIQALSQQLLAS